ncbi:MAG: hypothetical protein QF449_17550 [Alphaproteobacteria bacterium]|nr:hypothetical protein [Alphaproteobacteria bacterium]
MLSDFATGMNAYDRGDYEAALRVIRPLAELGHAAAQKQLGLMYAFGQVVPQDFVQSYMWFSLSISQGGESASELRNIVAKKMTPEQIAEAEKLAREWWPR